MTHFSKNQQFPITKDAAIISEMRSLFPNFKEELHMLLAGMAGCSPFLFELIKKEVNWITNVLAMELSPEKEVSNEVLKSSDIPKSLRIAKSRIALWTAMQDLSGTWELEDVSKCLSRFADFCIDIALKHAINVLILEGKFSKLKNDTDAEKLGIFILAMGKLGALELNYSSDIDLVCYFDDTKLVEKDFFETRKAAIAVIKKMTKVLSEVTENGYVFRTDLRLRPDPSVNPVCLGVDAAERYYEALGRTWERAAYIKARFCAGSQTLASNFLTALYPFVWRKYLDFAAIEEAHSIRVQYQIQSESKRISNLFGHDVKLGMGGIRDIEFFTQTRQLIVGGRDPDLQVPETLVGLAILAEKGWISEHTSRNLSNHYRFLRKVEHLLQMTNDAQTHKLPQTDDGFVRLANFMSLDHNEFKQKIIASLVSVHKLTESFFNPEKEQSSEIALYDSDTFRDDLVSRWPLYPSLRTARAEALFAKIQPIIMNKLSNAVDPNRALLSFDKFLFVLPAGVQLFSLFNTNRHLIDLFIDIISSSDALSEYLSNNVQVLDAVIGGAFWHEWPGLDVLREDLAIILRRETDYESQLNASRRWGREWHFRIGVHLLRGVITPEEAGTQYGDLALAMLKELWCLVNTQFSRKHGPAPGRGSALIGLGSLGIKKLHPKSDLDLILIYDAAGVEMSSGEKSIESRSYYARLTKALVAAISAPMNEKSLFHVDMRLRPSGNQGPVATSLQAFKHYQTSEAWVWEHLALVNATIVAGPEILQTDISRFCESLKTLRSEKNVMAGLSIMRNRLFSPSNINKKWSMKLGQGKLQDIELASQMGIILINEGVSGVHNGLIALQKLKKICAEDLAYLIKTYDMLLGVQILSKLLLKDDIKDSELGVNGKDLFLKYTDTPSVPLLVEKISEMAFNSSVIIGNILPNSKEVHDER